MKLENEPGYTVQTPPRKSYNPFESDDEDTDGFGKSNVNAYDIKSFEKNPESFTLNLKDGELPWEEALLGCSPVLSHAVPTDANGEKGLFRKDTELFTDKTITEYQLPEMTVCYKEYAYHSVKDIGIDEGVPVHDKVWVKSRDNHGNKNFSSILAQNGNSNGDLSLGNEPQALPCIENLKSRSENHLEKDASIQDMIEDSKKDTALDSEDLDRQHSGDQCGRDDSVKVDEFQHELSKKESNSSSQSTGDETKTNFMVYGRRDHQLTEIREVNYIKEENRENEVSNEEHGIDNVSLEHSEASTAKPPVMNSTEYIAKSSEIQREETTSFELPVSQESGYSGLANALSYNSKVESGSIVLDFDSSSTVSEKEELEEVKARQNVAAEKPLETQTMSAEKPLETQIMSVEKPPETQTVSSEKPLETQTVSAEKPLEPQTMSSEKPPETQTMSVAKPTETQTMSVEKPMETQTTSIEKPPMTQAMHRHDEGAPADMQFPASISYMGPSARFGSISLRSESSTGSTRSFAFPVLQAEWNSSPVRMAKAEQRNFRKHRGWVHSLMCCRF